MFVVYSLLVVFLVLYLCVQRKFYWLAWKIRGPIGFPFIGCVELLSPRNLLVYATKVRKSYNSPITAWLGPFCFLYIADPVNTERILAAPECSNKSDLYNFITQFIGSGLISSKNPEWSSHRKLLNPAFKTNNIFQFISVFNAKTKYLCEQLKEFSQLKRLFDVDDFLQEYTFNISSETILGQKSSMQYGNGNSIVKSYNMLIESVSKMIINPLYQSPVITKFIDSEHHKKFQEALQNVKKFVKECAEAASKEFSEVGIEPLRPTYSVISYMMELNRKGLLSTCEVISEIHHLIIGSYETTSKALLHIITLLAMHPEWQEKLYEEIEERFPDKNVELSFENIQDTPLIDIVIKETLRLLPVVPLKARVTNADFLLFDDVMVPKGTNIVVDIYSMHRDPKYWGADAMCFNPYRFLQDDITQRHSFVYVPFSKGLRNCIGWRYANIMLKVFVIKVFQLFRFATTLKPGEVDVTFNLSAKLTQKPIFTIEDRSKE